VGKKKHQGGRPSKIIEHIPLSLEELGELVMRTVPQDSRYIKENESRSVMEDDVLTEESNKNE